MGISNKEEFDVNDSGICFEDVIDGLNKYFAENETRVRVPRSIVEIRSRNKILFYRFDAEMYLDKLIAWLRTEHGIFYYPGMEAKYAKIEKIPPLTERLMDEGALNSLKKLHKRVTGEEPEVDSHTLIADSIRHAVYEKESEIEKLKEENQKLKDSLNMGRYGWLYEDVDHKSDINELIRNYCTKFDITPPSPDSSDRACVEYLLSVVDLERKHRAAVGKQMVDDYEKDLLKFVYKEYTDRTSLSDETITYNPSNICNTITKIISDYARNRTRVEILEGRIKCIFDKYKTKFTVDDYTINGDLTISFMLDCIGSWISSSTELKMKCDFLEDELGKEAVIREFLDRRRATQTKLNTIEKKLEELLKDVKNISEHKT